MFLTKKTIASLHHGVSLCSFLPRFQPLPPGAQGPSWSQQACRGGGGVDGMWLDICFFCFLLTFRKNCFFFGF